MKSTTSPVISPDLNPIENFWWNFPKIAHQKALASKEYHGVEVNVFVCKSHCEFKLQLHNCIQFQINTLGERYKPFCLPSYGLKSTKNFFQ